MLGTVLSLGPKVMNEFTIKAGSLLSWSLMHSCGQEIENR